MITELLSAICGYIIGYILVHCCSVCDRDQFLILCTTLLAIQIVREVKQDLAKWR